MKLDGARLPALSTTWTRRCAIQALFVGVIIRKYPRGGRSPKGGLPGPTPGRTAAFQ
jgi:hypothetical protein